MKALVSDKVLQDLIDEATARVLRLQSKAALTHDEWNALKANERELIRYRAEMLKRSIAAGKGE